MADPVAAPGTRDMAKSARTRRLDVPGERRPIEPVSVGTRTGYRSVCPWNGSSGLGRDAELLLGPCWMRWAT